MPHEPARYFTERELASRLSISPRTAQKWRYEGRGPRFVKAEGAVRYLESEVVAWERANTRQRTGGR